MQTGSLETSIEQLYNLFQDFAEKRKWHLKYAKFSWRSHQSLLTHSLNVASLSVSILDFLDKKELIKADIKLYLQIILTGFLHDSGKESELFQEAVRTFLSGSGPEPLDFGHQQEREIQPILDSLKTYLGEKIPNLNHDVFDEAAWTISQLGRREDSAAISHSFRKAPSKDALVCKEIVHLCDILASKLEVEDATRVPLDGVITSKLALTYSKVCVVRGVLTHFLHSAIEEQYEKQGFRAVQWFPDGTVYVGTKESDRPSIEKAKVVEALTTRMRNILNEDHSRQIAKAAFGSLTQQVIAAPEFLFAANETVQLFWQFISRQRFAKPNIRSSTKELNDSEKKAFELLSERLEKETEPSKLVWLARFVADFNLLIVLYAARKQLIENIPNDKKAAESEVTQKINMILSQTLEFPIISTDEWPEIALQTKIERRLPVALSLWQSPYYPDVNTWRTKLLEALLKATFEIAKMWRELVPDKYVKISNLLIADINAPITPEIMIKEAEDLSLVIAAGKSGHGTPTCQKCGGVACIEAQAKLFGSSEIYHDHLIAGGRVGGGNKLQVCELCDFEEKLRLMFLEGRTGYTNSFYVFPQLSLSRRQQTEWQSTMNRIEYNQGEMPSLLRLGQWAEVVTNGTLPFSVKLQSNSYFSENDLARAIQYVAEKESLENDLSPMIEPAIDAKNSKNVVTFLKQGKAKLKEDYEHEVYKYLNQIEPIYISPNFILILTRGTVAEKEEPESSAEIKWTLFRTLLARLFNAAVVPENFKISDKTSLGYTPVSPNLNLKPVALKLNAKKGWIDIPDLEQSIKKLSALLLIAHELSNSKADYGKSTLLRLIREEPGRVLNRLTLKGGRIPSKKLINSLNTWYY
jgi:hypothetical protein